MVKKKGQMTPTICWDCGNAGKCSYGAEDIPVKGWKAERHVNHSQYFNKDVISYCVFECPEYTKMRKFEPCDEGLMNLRDAIIKDAVKCYENSLAKEERARKDPALFTKRTLYGRNWRKLYGYKPMPHGIQDEERFLTNEWGQHLLYELEPEALIERMRREHGLD